MVGSGVAEGKSQLFYVEGLWKRVRKGSLRIEGHGRENIIEIRRKTKQGARVVQMGDLGGVKSTRTHGSIWGNCTEYGK